jgi:hypothetical protein
VITGGFPNDILVSTPAAGGLTTTLQNGSTGACEFYHSAFPAGTTTVNIIAVTG